jgi:tartrate/fumarate subfamily iron-sulfur-dependent hydro-lyase alpha chain
MLGAKPVEGAQPLRAGDRFEIDGHTFSLEADALAAEPGHHWFIEPTPGVLVRVAAERVTVGGGDDDLAVSAWPASAVALAALGEWAGFSKEAGAFLAGFSLASTPYREAIGARLTGIRDFLLLFFFIDLGAKLDFSTLGDEILPAAILSAFVLIGNPLIVMAIMGAMGYRKRTGFMAGLTVAQISEFSIIFVAMGISLGHVGGAALGLTTLVGIITITLSTYMILYSQPLFERLSPWLGIFERRVAHRENAEDNAPDQTQPEVIVYGLGRYGRQLAHRLQDAGLRVLGVDFDPQALASARRAGLAVCYGDAEDADFIAHLARAYEREQAPAAKDAIAQILTNSRMCAEGKRPLCQDTGIVNVFLKIGMDVRFEGFPGSIEDAVNDGVRRGYLDPDNTLRASVLADPIFERKNTKDNTPAVVHMSVVPGHTVDVTVAAKGGGSENKSKFIMMNPSDSIVDWVLKTVPTMGAGWCPPGMLGIGVGGTAEKAVLLVSQLLLRQLEK